MDVAGEATELGGFRVPSVMTEVVEALGGRAVEGGVCDSWDVILCLFLLDALDLMDFVDLGYRFLSASGTPSHFEFTLGIFSGSFLEA
jgi:hypothetical protein